MEDSFRVRVEKAFGSLASNTTTSSSSSLSSLWCLTDEEVERREWNRDTTATTGGYSTDHIPFKPCYSSKLHRFSLQTKPFKKQLDSDLKDLSELDNDGGDVEEAASVKKMMIRSDKAEDEEEWDIRSTIGLDTALEYEGEEDEYDQVAAGIGKEKAGTGTGTDRLYMFKSDISDYDDGYGIEINTENELPDTVEDVARDPRANHLAAKLRLKEDAQTVSAAFHCSYLHSGPNLEKKEYHADLNLQKCVPQSSNNSYYRDHKEEERQGPRHFAAAALTSSIEQDSHQKAESPVPDYVKNPSRYTHYTFDSSDDMDDKTNQQAYLDFINLLKKSSPTSSESKLDGSSLGIPKNLTFTPRQKLRGASFRVQTGNGFLVNPADFGKCKLPPVRITDGDVQPSEVCAMEEDDETPKSSSLRKHVRQYRKRANEDSGDDMT